MTREQNLACAGIPFMEWPYELQIQALEEALQWVASYDITEEVKAVVVEALKEKLAETKPPIKDSSSD